MRTVILVLGILFLELLEKHWNIPSLLTKEVNQFIAFLIMLSVTLDIFK
jgi:hypothetical protein